MCLAGLPQMGHTSPRCSCSKGHAPGGDAGLLLHADLAGLVAAPHGLGEAAPLLHLLLALPPGLGRRRCCPPGSSWPAAYRPSWMASSMAGHGLLDAVQGDEDSSRRCPGGPGRTGSSPCPWGRAPAAGARPSSRTRRTSSRGSGRSRPSSPGSRPCIQPVHDGLVGLRGRRACAGPRG